MIKRLLLVLAAAFAAGAAFFLLLEASHLEAERLNLGTLVGRADREPVVELWWVGLTLGALAVVLAAVARALPRDRR
jgi:hypothetical protein